MTAHQPGGNGPAPFPAVLHQCPGPGCPTVIKGNSSFCRRCWPKIPKPLRDALWKSRDDGRAADSAERKAAIEIAVGALLARRPALNPCTRCNGSGTEPRQPTGGEIRAYMTATGWAPLNAGGSAGVMWTHPDHAHDIGVTHEITPGAIEWRSVIERLAWAECRPFDAVAASIVARADAAEALAAAQETAPPP